MDSSYGQQDPRNPFLAASNPQMYAGSGYPNDPAASQGPPPQGYPGFGAQDAPMQTTEDFKNYTEQAAKEPDPADDRIDSNTGIHPQRYTDCVVIWIFGAYVIGMIIVLCIAASQANTSRLTRGYDYFGRLCGIDADVQDKPYLYFCRANPAEPATIVPTETDLQFPICVEKTTLEGSCPMAVSGGSVLSDYHFACLQQHSAPDMAGITGGTFGVAESKFIRVRQSIVITEPYDTKLHFGRYCLPTDTNIRGPILASIPFYEWGPINFVVRLWKSFGSFKNCWAVVWLSAIVSALVSVLLLFLFQVPKPLKDVLWLIYLAVGAFSCAVGIIFFVLPGVIFLVPGAQTWPVIGELDGLNPLFAHMRHVEAAVWSLVIGAVMFFTGFPLMGLAKKVGGRIDYVKPLITVGFNAMNSMKFMLWQACFEAFLKTALTAILCYHFMYFITVGYIDDKLTEVNGLPLQGPSKKFVLNLWFALLWGSLYAIGGLWIVEICTQTGQFMHMFSTMQWYFTPNGPGGKKLPQPFWDCLGSTFGYHFGTILYAAFPLFNPRYRFFRVCEFVYFDWLPADDSQDGCIAKCARSIKSKGIIENFPANKTVPSMQFIKHSYMDTIIRSTHLDTAMVRAPKVMNTIKAAKFEMMPGGGYMMAGQLMVFAGVALSGTIGGVVAYLMYTLVPWFTDQESSWYIQDPMFCTVVAFIVSCNVSYSFFSIFDDIMDAVLYCYAHNKKHNKKSCDSYMPDGLKDIVGNDHNNPDSYQFYGSNQVPASMYLVGTTTGSLMSTLHGSTVGSLFAGGGAKKEEPKKKEVEVAAPPPQAAQQSYAQPPGNAYDSQYYGGGGGGYPGPQSPYGTGYPGQPSPYGTGYGR